MGQRSTAEDRLTLNVAIGLFVGVILGLEIGHIPLGISLGMLLGAVVGLLPWRDNVDDDEQ
ncbi:hypothetical protein JYB87_02175 [Shewanella avicenniae]|uniref:Glycine zipper n=1 Tax=Shewanella avicenniae TaxID=2814294 RepID=A0ABX7QTT5_9GAMM|nr:hypothetical protein [Shewanella avicenniae]QSX34073.1 hypothetical protein JYB87_02175 [Shewanella avicenniae]